MDGQEDGVKGVVGGWAGERTDCLAGVQEVGNRLLLNEFVDKVFSKQTGGVFSVNITGPVVIFIFLLFTCS